MRENYLDKPESPWPCDGQRVVLWTDMYKSYFYRKTNLRVVGIMDSKRTDLYFLPPNYDKIPFFGKFFDHDWNTTSVREISICHEYCMYWFELEGEGLLRSYFPKSVLRGYYRDCRRPYIS